MGNSTGSMLYGVIAFLVVYFVGYFIFRVCDKVKKLIGKHSSKNRKREDDEA